MINANGQANYGGRFDQITQLKLFGAHFRKEARQHDNYNQLNQF